MDPGTKRALKIKKVVALSIKVGGSLASSTKTSQKRKNQSDEDRPLKKGANQPINLGQSGSQGTPNPSRHGVGKGLMMAHGPITNEPIPPPPALLVKDKQLALQTTYSIVKNLNLDKCSEHEMDALGDSVLFYLMRVSSCHIFGSVVCVFSTNCLPSIWLS